MSAFCLMLFLQAGARCFLAVNLIVSPSRVVVFPVSFQDAARVYQLGLCKYYNSSSYFRLLILIIYCPLNLFPSNDSMWIGVSGVDHE